VVSTRGVGRIVQEVRMLHFTPVTAEELHSPWRTCAELLLCYEAILSNFLVASRAARWIRINLDVFAVVHPGIAG